LTMLFNPSVKGIVPVRSTALSLNGSVAPVFLDYNTEVWD
jgi:hypothetical protein